MTNYIWQIYLSRTSNQLPKALETATKSIRDCFKDYEHKILFNDELRGFISNRFSKEVLWAFDSLKPLAFKCDLGRYCLLHEYGGWYFDISIICKHFFQAEEHIDMLVFRDELKHSRTSYAVANGIIWSKPKNQILEQAINDIVRNCKEKWYGETPLHPTGPVLFGEAIAKANRGLNLLYGDLICPKIPLTRKGIPFLKNIFRGKFILPDGKKFALLKASPGGDLSRLGAKGSDNYNFLWEDRDIYSNLNYNAAKI